MSQVKHQQVQEGKDQLSSNSEEQKGDYFYEKYIPFWSLTDLDNPTNRYLLIAFRLFQAVWLTHNMVHPDEYWQATEVAYNYVYGGVELPWEWHPDYRLRNTIYPFYLIGFLSVIKKLGLDYFIVVKLYPYLAHSILVIISDRYLWDVGKKTVGSHATRIALIFYLTNRIYNELIIRCFTNSIETISYIIAFYYYLDVNNKFTRTTAIMTALITFSFMMRNTSPVGWIPLLLLKIIYQKSFCAFLQAGIFVAIPIIGLCIAFDSLYFGELTITSLNFLRANILEGLSKYFGTDPAINYVFVYMPLFFTVAYPGIMYSFYVYFKDTKLKNQTPYMLYMVAFYLLVFSIIAHKEPRFLQPLVPFCFLMLGYLLSVNVKNHGCFIKFYIILAVIVELVTYAIMTNLHFRQWIIMQDLQDKPVAPHSVFSMQKIDIPYYSWTHRKDYGEGKNRTKVLLYQKDPPYARIKYGVPYQLLHDHDYNGCLQMIDDLQQGAMRPEYIITYEFLCGSNFYCYEACIKKFESLGMYELEKSYKTDIEPQANQFWLYRRTRFFYRLKEHLTPL